MVQPINNLVTIAGQSVDRATLTGLQNASEKSGVSFQYLLAKAAQESSLQTDARADTSSATGLFQFTRSTWLDMMKKYGSLYGYGDLAAKINVGSDGKASVTDPAAEKRLLALRGNAEASALMAAEYARDNATSLHETLGRGVDAADLYLAHFLGASGAGELLNAAAAKPSSSAVALLPAAAKANPAVFTTSEGHARSAADVVKLIRDRFTDKMDRYAEVAAAMTGEDTEGAVTSPRPVQVAEASTPRLNHMSDVPSPTNDPSKAMISHFMLEELAKLIAAKPMNMSDGSEDEANAEGGLSSTGFQGTDWSSAMTHALTKNSNAAAPIPKGRATEAMRTYDMLNAVPTLNPGAPFVPLRRKDPS